MPKHQATDDSALSVRVADLLHRRPVTIAPDTSITDAAAMMTEEHISSVLVCNNDELLGLLTDRDIRSRCVAVGLDPARPVSEIMTHDVTCIQQSVPVIEALMRMTRLQLHHLPVLDGETLVGMITATDLAQHQSTHATYLAGDVARAQSVDELRQISAQLPALQLRLASAGASALNIGEAVSCITDALTIRLLELAQAELGEPPVPYCWAAGGSQARREQSSHSDQDNALILSNDFVPEQHDAYFAELAKRVSDGLDACGFVYCPGDAMATNPEWRQPLSKWRDYFHRWIHVPEPKSLMLSSIFFDLRAVHGDPNLLDQLQDAFLEWTQNSSIFLAHITANALTHRPPLGFFRQFVLVHDGEHDDTLDIKHRGIVPITDLARVHALAKGRKAVNTTARLRAAADSGALNPANARSLEDALEFIAKLRMRHQAGQIKSGQRADNYLPPTELSTLEREYLKDAFKLIKTLQESLEHRYQATTFR